MTKLIAQRIFDADYAELGLVLNLSFGQYKNRNSLTAPQDMREPTLQLNFVNYKTECFVEVKKMAIGCHVGLLDITVYAETRRKVEPDMRL